MATERIKISELLHREWGRVTDRVDIDDEGIITLRDPEKPILCWAQYIPNDLVESVDGSEIYCIYEYLGEFRQMNLSTRKQVELGRTVKISIYHRDIKQCEIMDTKLLKAILATRRVVDYSVSYGDSNPNLDVRGIGREITILY